VIAARSWTAWSSTVRLVVEGRCLSAAAADLASLLDEVDRAASRFRDDSELSAANRSAGAPVAVSRLLSDLVSDALAAAEQTQGIVDPTIGAALIGWGYDRDIAELADTDQLPSARRSVSWCDVGLDRERGLLTVPRGAALDLGATAKAATADRAATALHARYGVAVLVELGGDLAVAGDPPGGWVIQVAEREGANGQAVALAAGGMATSTTTIRRWSRGGQPVHHIIDPRSGNPADGCWRTATVVAASALAANTASTAAIVLGQEASGWLAAQGLPARLVNQRGEIVTTSGWPAATAAAAS
jgi:thiamine biosynthesis lipoprotein